MIHMRSEGSSIWSNLTGQLLVNYLGKSWHQDVVWKEGKLVESARSPRQCSAGKPWILLLWHITFLSIVPDRVHHFIAQHSLWAVASFSRMMHLHTKFFRNGLRNIKKVSCFLLREVPESCLWIGGCSYLNHFWKVLTATYREYPIRPAVFVMLCSSYPAITDWSLSKSLTSWCLPIFPASNTSLTLTTDSSLAA